MTKKITLTWLEDGEEKNKIFNCDENYKEFMNKKRDDKGITRFHVDMKVIND